MTIDPSLKVVLGMTLAYVASLAGMFFAWYHYRKRHPKPPRGETPP